MKPIKVTKERGQCSICRHAIKRGDVYYDIDGLWVHVNCWNKQYPLSKQSETNDVFISAIQRNAIKAKDIPSMIQKLNEIRGDTAFDETEFVFKDFVLKEYKKLMEAIPT